MPQRSPRPSGHRAVRARDAGLRRISVVTRVLVGGSVVAAGAFSALAAWAQPGRSKSASTAGSSAAAPNGGFGFSRGNGSPAGSTSNTVPSSSSPSNASSNASSSSTGSSNTVAGDGNAVQPLSPPATAPATVPDTLPASNYQQVPSYQYVSPPVVSGAS